MKKLFALIVLTPLLGGCLFDQFANPISLTTQYDIEAGYLTAENIALVYMALPLCKTGTTATVAAPCARRSLIVKIQDTGRKAQAAVIAMRNFVKANPTLSPITAIGAAQTALADFQFALSATQTH